MERKVQMPQVILENKSILRFVLLSIPPLESVVIDVARPRKGGTQRITHGLCAHRPNY